ncbi:MAG TPA: glycosyltransferase family 2 protein [Candidatus Saccharimonadales bacterium]|nr:glycosyltransferase family 2 protein [Candidatus Saccharimonadales bacterium]
MKQSLKLISIVVPCYNESPSIDSLYQELCKVMEHDSTHRYELLYINDGSQDETLSKLQALAASDERVHVLSLSKNFGKEIATTAGIQYASGDAVIMLDADGQHPPNRLPEFVQAWEQGARVVTGVRNFYRKEGAVKKYLSKLFYRLLQRLTGTHVVMGATDFRLIDKTVQQELLRMTERSRMTRGLIDWMGFSQTYIYYDENPRLNGTANYSYAKLFSLALNSFISLSLKPLYFAFYTGLVIMPLSLLLALACGLEMVIGDPLQLNITGTAYLVMLALFLLGLVLISQGITALYLSHIHTETQNRPLFIVDAANSRGV